MCVCVCVCVREREVNVLCVRACVCVNTIQGSLRCYRLKRDLWEALNPCLHSRDPSRRRHFLNDTLRRDSTPASQRYVFYDPAFKESLLARQKLPYSERMSVQNGLCKSLLVRMQRRCSNMHVCACCVIYCVLTVNLMFLRVCLCVCVCMHVFVYYGTRSHCASDLGSRPHSCLVYSWSVCSVYQRQTCASAHRLTFIDSRELRA